MKKILVSLLILGLIVILELIFVKIYNVKADDSNIRNNLSSCLSCLIVTQYPTPNPFNSYNSYTTIKFKVMSNQYFTIYILNKYHDLGWFTYNNCSGAIDGVGYCKEIIPIGVTFSPSDNRMRYVT